MNPSARAAALEKLAWNPISGIAEPKSTEPETRLDRIRRVAGKALVRGGTALQAQGLADAGYKSWKAKNLIKDAPKLTHEQAAQFIPGGTQVLTNRYDQLIALGGSNSATDRVVNEVHDGRNAFYKARPYSWMADWRYLQDPSATNGTLILPPHGVNGTILAHELGHRKADFSRKNPGDYESEIISAQTEDRPVLPQDMFTAPSTNAFGKVTLPGIEREAWNNVPKGMKADPKIRDAALESYVAARKANAKSVYGTGAQYFGALIRPRKKGK